MRGFSVLSCLFAITGPALVPMHAQLSRPADAVVSGLVTDPSGAVIPGAAVVLHQEGHADVTATSGAAGAYSLTAPAGVGKITVNAEGFAPYRSEPVELAAGRHRTLNIQMRIEAAEQQVEVSGETVASTDPANNGDQVVLRQSEIDALPTNSTQLSQQLQGMSGGPNPDIYVDGFSGGTIPPKDTIREIRINQNPYSALNDTNPVNGQIQIFTKPGSEKLHGDLFLTGNTSGLNSQNPFVTQTPAYYSYNSFGSLGGPINKTSSFRFGVGRRSYQGNAVVAAQVLDANLNQTAMSAAVAAPNTNTDFNARYDASLGKKSTIIASYSSESTVQTNGGVGGLSLASTGFNSTGLTQTLRLSNSQIINAKIVNDTRFQYTRTRARQTPYSFAPTVVVQGAFNGGGSSTGAFHDNLDKYELQNYWNASEGKHYLTFGARLRAVRDSNESLAGYNGQFIFSTLAAYQITQQGVKAGLTGAQIRANGGGASQFTLAAGTPGLAVTVADVGAFLQDDWKVRPNFTLSGGLRFESQTSIHDHGDWAPRVGFAWGLFAKKDKPTNYTLRGGAGIFYRRFVYNNVLQAERENGTTMQQYVVQSPDFYPNVPAASTLASTTPSAIYQISPGFHAPYYIATTVALDRRIGTYGQVSVNWVTNRGVHVQMSRNVNAPLPGTYNVADPTSGVRPLGGQQNVYQYQSEGVFDAKRLSVNMNLHVKRMWVYGFYQALSQHADTEGSFPSNQYNLGADYGRTVNDTRNNLNLGTSFELPFGFQGYTYVSAQSSAPFNIVLGQDLNGDAQYNDRPTFATDLTRASVVRTRYGTFDTAPIAGQTVIPYNYGNGPSQFFTYVGLGHAFSFGPEIKAPAGSVAPKLAPGAKAPKPEKVYSVDFSLNVENVFNHQNLSTPVGTLNSTLFGRSTGLAGGNQSGNREVEMQMYFHF